IFQHENQQMSGLNSSSEMGYDDTKTLKDNSEKNYQLMLRDQRNQRDQKDQGFQKPDNISQVQLRNQLKTQKHSVLNLNNTNVSSDSAKTNSGQDFNGLGMLDSLGGFNYSTHYNLGDGFQIEPAVDHTLDRNSGKLVLIPSPEPITLGNSTPTMDILDKVTKEFLASSPNIDSYGSGTVSGTRNNNNGNGLKRNEFGQSETVLNTQKTPEPSIKRESSMERESSMKRPASITLDMLDSPTSKFQKK
ncbi:hypothetical protein BB558_005745, partial [Smittium angustum]